MLTRLQVSQLWGSRSLEVKFNPDLTLLYGINGSGKTTILNIIGAIASGHVEALMDYQFKEIVLEYQKNRKDRCIRIVPQGRTLHVDINGQAEVFDPGMTSTSQRMLVGSSLYGRLTAREESVSKALRNEFELIYLPLSRDSRSFDNNTEAVSEQLTLRFAGIDSSGNARPTGSLDESLKHVGELAKENHRRTMFTLNEINQTLRQDMFETSLSFSSKSLGDALAEFRKFDDSAVSDLKAAFGELQLLSPRFAETIDTFFQRLTYYADFLKNNKESDPEALVKFLVHASQVELVQKWQDLAEKANRKREKALEPMETFLGTVNHFFAESGKALTFDSKSGSLWFVPEPSGKSYSLDKLSSGEKQILIFFAYLVFRANSKRAAIFLIDEPELSLHLGWQRRFTRSVTNAAPGVQLVFATHSPEIVGPFRERTVEVQWRN